MEAQAHDQLPRYPLPTLGTPRPTCACATCRGTGALGRTHKFVGIGDTVLVTTQTRWCPTCGGAGLVVKENAA